MLQIGIVDDNADFANKLEKLLLQESKKKVLEVDTQVYSDGDELLRDYWDGIRYDFIYLDIEMERVNGIETAKKIREMDKTVLIIYVSSYEHHCKNLFVFEPVRYLEKPLKMDAFVWTFSEAYKRVGYIGATFQYSYKRKIREVALKDIIYFKSDDRVIHVHLTKAEEGEEEREIDQHFYGMTLDYLEKELKKKTKHFLRIDRSYLVNHDHLVKITPSTMLLRNGAGVKLTLDIAKNRQIKVRKQLAQIHKEMG